jgi:hypothetical protein
VWGASYNGSIFKKWKIENLCGFQKLNKSTKKDPYLLPFSNEVLNTITWHEAYSFLRFHHIFTAFEDRSKIIFVTNWKTFVWMVMPFGVKNGPLIF